MFVFEFLNINPSKTVVIISRNVSISKCGVELKPIPFDELPIETQEWLQSEEYGEMGTSLQSYRDLVRASKRRRIQEKKREVSISSESDY